MKRNLVLAEWKRAIGSLGAAESCWRDGFYADAVSRTYYAILHGAKAALLVKKIEAESHAAARRLFGLHLVQTGFIEAEWGALLGESSDVRMTADYDVETHLTEIDAQEECDHARSFLLRVRAFLLANGFTPDELHTEILDAC